MQKDFVFWLILVSFTIVIFTTIIGGLSIVEAEDADPIEFTLISSYDLGSNTTEVEVQGDFAYVCVQNGIKIINISDPASPTLVGLFNTTGTPQDLVVMGDYTFIADSEDGLVILNTTSVAHPTIMSKTPTNGTAKGIAVNGNYTYLVDDDTGLVIFNTSNFSDPEFIRHAGSVDAHAVALDHRYAYLADGPGGVKILDIEDPAFPRHRINYQYVDYAVDVTVYQKYMYIADRSGEIHIVHVPWYGGMEKVGTVSLEDQCNSVLIDGPYVFATIDQSGFVITNRWYGTVPEVLGGNGTSAASYDIAISGSSLLVADGENGLSFYQMIPQASIYYAIPEQAALGQRIRFYGTTNSLNRIETYAWRSSIDGEMYNGPSASLSYYNLSLGNHTIYLKVLDDEGVWSSEDSINVQVIEDYPADYGQPKNQTAISLFPSKQASPSIDGDIVAWLDDRNGGYSGEVFLFDLENPEIIQKISHAYRWPVDNDTYHIFSDPLVSDRKVIWLDRIRNSSATDFELRLYDHDDPILGGEVIFHWDYVNIGSIEFSGDLVVWSEFSGNWSQEKPYSIHLLNIISGEHTELFNVSSPFDFQGDRLVYVEAPDTQIEGSERSTLIVYDLTTRTIEKELSFLGDPDDITSLDLWGDHVVWRGYRGGSLHYSRWDIFLLDISEEKMTQLTTDSRNENDPFIHGDIVVWVDEDERSGNDVIRAYSISRNRFSMLDEAYGHHPYESNPASSGDMLVWERTSSVGYRGLHLEDISSLSWNFSGVIFTDISHFFPITTGGDIPFPIWEIGYQWTWNVTHDDSWNVSDETRKYQLIETVIDDQSIHFSIPCYEVIVQRIEDGRTITETVWLAKDTFNVVDTTMSEEWDIEMFRHLQALQLPVGGILGGTETYKTREGDGIKISYVNYQNFYFNQPIEDLPTYSYSPGIGHIISLHHTEVNVWMKHFTKYVDVDEFMDDLENKEDDGFTMTPGAGLFILLVVVVVLLAGFKLKRSRNGNH